MSRHGFVGFVVGSTLQALLVAQTLPAPVGDGPLLCFRTDHDAGAHHEVTLHVTELGEHDLTKPFWRGRHNVEVLRRLDRDHLLLASYGEPYALLVVDLPAGTQAMLADGAPHEFVAVRDDVVLHLGDPREPARDNFFYATPWHQPADRRRLCEQRFDAIAQIEGNLAVGLAANETSVWIVSLLHASGRKVWTAPTGVHNVRVALSPGGQRLAIGCVATDGKGVLAVVDTGTGVVLHSWPELPIQVSPFSSNRPCLEVGWFDDAEVICSETRGDRNGMRGDFVHVRRSLATGAITDEHAYASIGLSHRAPPPPRTPSATEPLSVPVFTTEVVDKAIRLLRAGQREPLAVGPDDATHRGETRVAPDGQSAVACGGGEPPACVLFTATGKEPRRLAAQGARGFLWLPAMTTATERARR